MENKNYCELHKGTATIYTLSDKNGDVFYVGCTLKSFAIRFSGHLSEAKSSSRQSARSLKCQKIRELNFDVVGCIVDQKYVTGDNKWALGYEARDLEKEWIEKYIQLGYSLCNKEAFPKEGNKDFVGMTLTVKNGKIIKDKSHA